jgi:hypothetical protein
MLLLIPVPDGFFYYSLTVALLSALIWICARLLTALVSILNRHTDDITTLKQQHALMEKDIQNLKGEQ